MKNSLSILTYSLLLLLPFFGFAQNDEGMMIFQIDGNRYERKNFKKDGKLRSYQSIEVGSLTRSAEKIEAKLTVITYDENNDMKGASQTVITCDPESGEVIMGIFPFAGGATNKSLSIELAENNQPYPEGWREQETLADFTFSLDFKGGAAGFFGTKSKVSFVERSVTKPSDSIYRISGKMILIAYALGIRISTIEYDYSEDIEQKTGIIQQKFKEKNGNYFTLEIKR